MAQEQGPNSADSPRRGWRPRLRRLLRFFAGEPRSFEGYTKDFGEVLRAEREAIAERQRYAYHDPEGSADSSETRGADADFGDDLVGLSLSGGGIRSATFNLGLIQAMHQVGMFRHVDYLVTTSGGGYIGSHLAKKAAQASDRAKAIEAAARAQGSNGRPRPAPPTADTWFPYPIGPGGKQDRHVLDFYKRGDYLNRPTQLAWIWLPGTILNLLMLISLMACVCAGAAFVFRIPDFPWSDSALRWLGRTTMLALYRFKSGLGGDAEGILAPIPATALLMLLGLGVPTLLWGVGEVLGGGRQDSSPSTTPGRERLHFDSLLRRLGRLLFWPMTILALIGGSILWADWPTREEIDRGYATAEAAIKASKAGDGAEPLDQNRIEGAMRQAERWNTEVNLPGPSKDAFYEAGHRSTLLIDLLSGDPARLRRALPQVDGLLPPPAPTGPVGFDRMADVDLFGAAARRVGPTIELLDAATTDAKVPLEAQASLPAIRDRAAILDPAAIRSTLAEVLATTRAIEINNLVITDLLRGVLWAIVCTLLYAAVASWQYVTRGVRQFVGRHPNDRRAKLARASWICLGLGLIVCATNGDTDIGGLKFLLPNFPGFETVRDQTTGLDSGTRIAPSMTLDAIRSWAFIALVAVAFSLAMVPIASRTQFIRSAEQPKDSLQGRFFRLVLGAVVYVLPLAGFAFMARENVSGAAPPKPPIAAVPAGAGIAGGGADVARMAYCPDSPYLDRNYLINNDQAVRAIVCGLSALICAFLALSVDLNHTSIHTFYRDRLYEAYLADSTHEERRKIRLSKQDGSRVGFPLHLLSATLNQFHGADESEATQHTFSFSKLYCGSAPTGYRRTDRYRDGVDLADAVAISGAAISPVQSRALATRLVMLVVNMRLGQWYSNPNPAYQPRHRSSRPNLATLLLENVGPFRRRRPVGLHGPDERRRFCFLSDGAHLDNLGILMMLKRRCRLMIVSDVSHDPNYACEELAAVFRYVSANEGITFTPIPMATVRERLGLPKLEIAADPDTRLDPFHFRSTTDADALRRLKARLARENFLVGRVDYPEGPSGPRSGILVLVKPSLTAELVDQTTLLQHFLSHEHFPHDSDLDQIFDEARVEAYRQLGESVGNAFGHFLGRPGTSPSESRRLLLAAVQKLLDTAADPSPASPEPAKAPGHVPA